MNNEIENKIDLAVSTAKKAQVEANTMIGNERMSRLELEKTFRANEEAQQHFIRYVNNECGSKHTFDYIITLIVRELNVLLLFLTRLATCGAVGSATTSDACVTLSVLTLPVQQAS